jgi:hypothetical protein
MAASSGRPADRGSAAKAAKRFSRKATTGGMDSITARYGAKRGRFDADAERAVIMCNKIVVARVPRATHCDIACCARDPTGPSPAGRLSG